MAGIRIGFNRCLLGTLASIASLAMLAGCAGPAAVIPATPPWWAPYLTVDSDLKMLGLTDLRLTRARTESGFLRVVGEYFNRSESKLTAIFRFTWLDASGQPVDSILGSWQAVHALPRTRATFAGIAPRADIEDFRAELISAHRLKGRTPPANSDR